MGVVFRKQIHDFALLRLKLCVSRCGIKMGVAHLLTTLSFPLPESRRPIE